MQDRLCAPDTHQREDGMLRTLYKFLILSVFFGHPAHSADRVIMRGDMGFEPQRLEELAPDSKIDLKGATFRVAISKNNAPTEGKSCESGNLPINRYPFAVEHSPSVRISGGFFDGSTPESSDWLHTYCNSAALRIEESPDADIRELALRQVWDGIRFDKGSADFLISGVRMADVRDDCVENDNLLDGTIKNSLFDGCFAGISVAKIDDNAARPTVEVDQLLMRMQQYTYRGKPGHALPIKIQEGGPKLVIRNSVIAVDTQNLIGGKHIALMWATISHCEGNQLLWLGEGTLPEIYGTPPSCFTVLDGADAQSAWDEAKQTWLSENQGLAPLPGDHDS